MVRISDIAKEVGVSRSLVSKVLSGRLGRSSARPDLAAKIHARAKELGYVPNASAKALFSGRQNVIGVFVHQYGRPSSGLVEKVMSAISRELAKNHQRMLLQFFSDDDEFANCLDLAHPSVMDGVMLASTYMLEDSDALKAMVARGLPVISLSDKPFVPGSSNVGIDQTAVGRLATLHLLDRGCRRIVHFRGHADALRFKGYRAALAERGVPYDPQLAFATRSYSATTIPRFFGALLEDKVPFDGVVAASDEQAAIIMRMLQADGRRIPKHVKIIGTDDAPFGPLCSVPLSSVSGLDHRRAGIAIRMLLDQINGAPSASRILAPVVVERESTACEGTGFRVQDRQSKS